MSTALSTIWAEIDLRLAAVVQPDGGSYERMASADPEVFPALEAIDGGEEPIDAEGGPDSEMLELGFTVEGFVENYSGAASHDAMAELHASAVKALCGDAGNNLGGLVESIRRIGRRRVDVAELAERRRLGFAQDFAVTYATPRGDPATLL
jgi:hypothetical protein